MDPIAALEKLLASGQDTALLRFGLGQACLKAGRIDAACEHLAQALHHDPGYSAAWKLYGKALSESGQTDAAIAAYSQGVTTAEGKGDIQAAKEMRVFLKRLQKPA